MNAVVSSITKDGTLHEKRSMGQVRKRLENSTKDDIRAIFKVKRVLGETEGEVIHSERLRPNVTASMKEEVEGKGESLGATTFLLTNYIFLFIYPFFFNYGYVRLLDFFLRT